MTVKEIIDGLKFTIAMFLFDPDTGETFTEPRNDMDKTTIDACKGAIELLEQTRWIPVSERSPKAEYGEGDSVLVCFEDETQDVLYFDGSNWRYPTGETYISVNYKNDWHNKVVAWMPLPEPYQLEIPTGSEGSDKE